MHARRLLAPKGGRPSRRTRPPPRRLQDPPALARAIVDLDRSKLEAKRRTLEKVRERFIYDWSGESADAFSSTLSEICATLGLTQFDCHNGVEPGPPCHETYPSVAWAGK